MLFLFDNSEGQSVFRDCSDWDAAEQIAEDENLELIGRYRYTHFWDADTGDSSTEFLN